MSKFLNIDVDAPKLTPVANFAKVSQEPLRRVDPVSFLARVAMGFVMTISLLTAVVHMAHDSDPGGQIQRRDLTAFAATLVFTICLNGFARSRPAGL